MKRILIGLVAIVAIPLVWIAVDDFNYSSLSPMTRAERSPLIVYAKCNTNDASFFVREIWKDTRKSHSPVVGLKLHLLELNAPDVKNPDGVIVFYEKDFWFSRHLSNRGMFFVNSGRIEGMTLEEYKKACGLNNASP